MHDSKTLCTTNKYAKRDPKTLCTIQALHNNEHCTAARPKPPSEATNDNELYKQHCPLSGWTRPSFWMSSTLIPQQYVCRGIRAGTHGGLRDSLFSIPYLAECAHDTIRPPLDVVDNGDCFSWLAFENDVGCDSPTRNGTL